MSRVICAVLAAGSGSRMGTPKAELEVAGVRLVDHAVAAFAAADAVEIIAVVRPGVDVPAARVVVNDAPERGMRSSLQLAVDAAAGLGPDALAVLLVDTPGITAAAVRVVLEAWTPGRVAVATYGGRRGHPTVMSLEQWRVALELAGPDEGGRALLRARPELVDEVAVDGDPADLDTPEDLRRWQAADARLTVLVQGRVQGVGFRYWTRDLARELGLRGSATNLRDGRVRVIAEGSRSACERLLAALDGPSAPGAVVDLVPIWAAPEGEPERFRIG